MLGYRLSLRTATSCMKGGHVPTSSNVQESHTKSDTIYDRFLILLFMSRSFPSGDRRSPSPVLPQHLRGKVTLSAIHRTALSEKTRGKMLEHW